MRLIMFILKCVVGLLASLGFLIVAGVTVLAIWADDAQPWVEAEVEVPEQTVLSFDLAGGLVEGPSDDFFSQFPLADVLTLREAVEALEAASADPRVEGMIARLGIGELGLAQVQELRQAIERFRESGKFTVAFAESFGEGGHGTLHYYLASAFDEVWLQPSGDFDISGLALEMPFLREALDEIGVEPRIDEREDYKGAMAGFTERELPAPQRENLQRLLDSWLGQLARDMAAARGSDEAAVRAAIDTAPHAAVAALDQGLVDRLGYWDEVSAAVLDQASAAAEFLPLFTYAQVHDPLPTPGPLVALIYGVGPVVLASSGNDGLFDEGVMAADTVAEAIAEAVDDPEIAAIVLRIDSPGGSYVASDAIWREVQLAREAGKPLIVSMSNLAASGGYFVAAPAHKIVALPGSVTGSIGVVSGKLVLRGLWDKLGIAWDGVEAGASAGYWSMNRDFSEAEWARLQASLDRVYADFTSKVAAGRALTPEQVAAAAQGQVWSGEDALGLGLVDELGGLETALALAAEAAGAPGERPAVKILPEPRDPFEAVVEDLLAGQIEMTRLRGLLRDLTRLAVELRPLTEAMDRGSAAAQGPQLRAPELKVVPAKP